MKQYTFKDGIKVIASSAQEAKSKHLFMATACKSKKKNRMTPEQLNRVRETTKKVEEVVKSTGLQNVINTESNRYGNTRIYLKDAFGVYIDVKQPYPSSIEELIAEFDTPEEVKKSLEKNKDKWIELAKCAHRIEELVKELGLVSE